MMNIKKCLLLLCLCVSMSVSAQKKLNVVFVGNSITQGALLENPEQEAPPVRTGIWLGNQTGISEVNISNQGMSGKTTVDFLPASKSYFPKVKEAMAELQQKHPGAVSLFSIMLGTNDSANTKTNGAPVSAPQYYTNMKVIIDELMEAFPNALIVLHYPIWYSPNTYNGAQYLASGLKRLTSYYPCLQELVDYYAEKCRGKVFLGDTEATAYFETHYQTELRPEQGYAGIFYLHPNKQGAESLATFWGKAIYKAVMSR